MRSELRRRTAGRAGLTRLLRRPLPVIIVATCLAGPALAQDRPATADDTCRRASFKVLIDVGHTPEDPGAISAHGNPEYSYNLSLAGSAMEHLVEAGFRQTGCC
jgi:N-acetylmuramoyl-L-alanine amidase